ncbi:PREDICTED: thioredoxin reductase 2, mitochondrial-like [Diuraphis noxia]|uniref:thioredoxin reductase 2, mitochondrial-like n=1 Tax=Diuraphis noxia TaxID=143948 RepID=UPI000763698A|nr:PREDICTED: thioredoxin reductase 2, mitochondrial-like [Diuraphis noxia]
MITHAFILIKTNSGQYDFDLLVIGGASGGLACAKEASSFGKQVVVIDFVIPSEKGFLGIQPTLTQVPPIPQEVPFSETDASSIIVGSLTIQEARNYGFNIPDPISFNWKSLTEAVKEHIQSVNWAIHLQLEDKCSI